MADKPLGGTYDHPNAKRDDKAPPPLPEGKPAPQPLRDVKSPMDRLKDKITRGKK